MSKTPKVIEATNKPGLIKHLDELHSHLTLCEKALAEYLETKRLAFPRFYFVSAADLLDILSNGNNPDLVVRYSFRIISIRKKFYHFLRLVCVYDISKYNHKNINVLDI